MASPPSTTLSNLSGTWTMNKSLSSDIQPALSLQGVSWFLRRAISLATITLHTRQYDDPAPPHSTHIDIEQTATGGIKGTTELRTLDGQIRDHTDYVFGTVQGRSRWVGLGEVEDAWLRGAGAGDTGKPPGTWLMGDGDTKDGRLVSVWVKSEPKGWVAEQVWGFQNIEGKRCHVRLVVVTKGEERKELRLVYDFLGREEGGSR
ncbi:MAG: hypothetical protein M1816_002049 [Peltula sp. TS41687]|nr:MAG: hypothetical protein M1816_002049 [Peltula sp. TS41687]